MPRRRPAAVSTTPATIASLPPTTVEIGGKPYRFSLPFKSMIRGEALATERGRGALPWDQICREADAGSAGSFALLVAAMLHEHQPSLGFDDAVGIIDAAGGVLGFAAIMKAATEPAEVTR